MKRSCAREIAMRMCFVLSNGTGNVEEQLERFFEPEYYASLQAEDAVFSEYPDERQKDYISRLVRGIALHNAELDGYIAKYATKWKFDRISRTALAVIKTAMYEILYMPEVPTGTAINEAVELAKKYEEPATIPFINGVLGGFARNEAVDA